MKTFAKGAGRLLGALLLLVVMVAIATPASAALTKIADNVYAYVGTKEPSPHNAFAANVGVIVGQDAILVVDSLMSAKQAQKLIEDIRAISDKPIKYLVNTHYHLDHALGNSQFVKLGATVISHNLDRDSARVAGPEMIKRAATYGLSPEELEGTTLAVPTISFSDRMEIDLGGGQVVHLIYPGPSHTKGSILVWLPGSKVLFTGDILFTDFHPFLAEGDLKGWAKVLDYAQTLGAAQIIPGHGPVSHNEDLRAMKTYLAQFDKKAKQLSAKYKDLDQLAAALQKQLPPRADGAFLIKGNLGMRYLKK